MNPNLYEVLGVKETATPDEIKRAYRDLAKRYHPDRHGGDKAKESKFKEVSAAYDVLSDGDKRKKYDAMRRGGSRDAGPGEINIEDFLAQMFGGNFAGAQAGRTRRRGGPQVIFEQYGDFDGGFGGYDPFSRQVRREPVRESTAERLVRTPDGHELVQRGDDLYVDAQVTIEEAVVGGKVTVPTLDGMVTVTVPPGTSSGRKLRLRGRGASGAGGRGDQYVVVQIVVPGKVDDKARELLREFSRRAPVEVHVPGRGKKAGAR